MDKEKLMTEEEWLAKYNAGHKKSKKKNVRKWLRNGVALGLVAVLSIAGTLAYLQKETDPKTNTFTGSAGLKLTLTETQWDWDNDDTADTGEPMEAAGSYKPGTEYLKNPQLVNGEYSKLTITNHEIVSVTDDTNKYDEYVAMRIDFKGSSSAVTYGDILSVIEPIEFNITEWVLIKSYTDGSWNDVSNADIYDNGQYIAKNTLSDSIKNANSLIFVYKDSSGYKILNKNTVTSALYTKIKTLQSIPSTLGGGNITDKDFPEFKLVMSGAAVDKDAVDLTTGSTSATQTNIADALFGLLN